MTVKPGILFIMITGMISGCMEDNSEDLKEQEMKLLQQYLVTNNITVDPTTSGLYYIPIREGTGISPDTGTWVEIHYIGEMIDGTVFETSYEEIAEVNGIYEEGYLYRPARIQLGYLGLEGLNEGIQLMRVGGKAQLIIPSDLGLGGYQMGMVPAYSTLIYTLELMEAFDDPAIHEQELIWAYIRKNTFQNVDSTESGLYYIREQEGIGETFAEGTNVSVWYTGSFLDGRVFECNLDEEAYSFAVPGSTNIEGWKEGIRLMRDGEKGILIIPYTLGYGAEGRFDEYGRIVVPPYMTLVYEMEAELNN